MNIKYYTMGELIICLLVAFSCIRYLLMVLNITNIYLAYLLKGGTQILTHKYLG